MELIECVKYSLEKQSIEQGKTLYSSSNRSYINKSLSWSKTIEGHLFWNILNYTYYCYGTYDYITIIKLYKRYGRDVFNSGAFVYYRFSTLSYYRDYLDRDTYTLTDEGFRLLCKDLESYGAIRRD